MDPTKVDRLLRKFEMQALDDVRSKLMTAVMGNGDSEGPVRSATLLASKAIIWSNWVFVMKLSRPKVAQRNSQVAMDSARGF